MKHTQKLVALDCGNANIKITDGKEWVSFPHALKRLTDFEIDEYEGRGELTTNPDIFQVNGSWYMIGHRAIRRGAGEVLFGENRYKKDYYGILAAIALFKLLPDNERNLFLIGEHTPKDSIYRQDLIDAVLGTWSLASMGTVKVFTVEKVRCVDEPAGVFRYATLNQAGNIQSGWLLQGRCCVIDLGGFTTGFSVFNQGHVDHNDSTSLELGMLDQETKLELLLRKNHKDKLRGAQWLEPLGLRYALAHPKEGYDAHGAGWIPCEKEVDSILTDFVNRLRSSFEGLGGLTRFDTILLGGGGTGTMEKRLKTALNHPHTYVVESNLEKIHLASCMGAWRSANILLQAGKLS